jgi:hypothetical protein
MKNAPEGALFTYRRLLFKTWRECLQSHPTFSVRGNRANHHHNNPGQHTRLFPGGLSAYAPACAGYTPNFFPTTLCTHRDRNQNIHCNRGSKHSVPCYDSHGQAPSGEDDGKHIFVHAGRAKGLAIPGVNDDRIDSSRDRVCDHSCSYRYPCRFLFPAHSLQLPSSTRQQPT